MPSHTLDQTHLPCSICPQFFHPDDLNECSCGDLICATCPAFACSCVDEGQMQGLRAELRSAAIEFAELGMTEMLMGREALTQGQHARMTLLRDVVDSLRTEICRLDEDKFGEVYEDDL